jgi:hypothetical protein
LNVDGTFTANFVLTGLGKFAIRGALDVNNKFSVTLTDGKVITGELVGGNLRFAVTSGSNVYDSTMVRSPALHGAKAGSYTMLLPIAPSQANDPSIPHGTGYAVVVVGNNGTMRIVGSLGDGAKFGTGTGILADHTAPFFAGLYPGQTGKLQGTLTFETLTGANASDIDGALTWVKAKTPNDATYPAGFTATTNAVGSLYTTPAKQNKMLTLNSSGAVNAAFSEGNLTATASATANIPATGDPTVIRPLRSLSLGRTSGLFSGYFVHSDGTSKPFRGIVFQKQNRGAGYFLGSSKSGLVTLSVPIP